MPVPARLVYFNDINAMITEAMTSEKDRLLLISRITEEINAGKTYEELVDLLYLHLKPLVTFNRIAIALLNDKQDSIELVSAKSDSPMILDIGYRGKLSGSTLQRIIERREFRIINDLPAYLGKKPESKSTEIIVREGMQSSLTLPLIARDKPVGIMFFSSLEKNVYDEGHVEFLKLIAGHVAISIERALILKELRSKTEQLENILRDSADGIIIVDRNNRITVWNRGAENIFGWKQEEVLGKNITFYYPPENNPMEELHDIMEQLEKYGYSVGYEATRLTKDGRRIVVSITLTNIKNPDGEVVGRSAIVRDMTLVKKLQHELINAQSLAAVGELAATVAHEIRNPLTAISSSIQVLVRSLPIEDSRSKVGGQILEQVKRLDTIIRDLLLYSRPWKVQPQQFNLSDLVAHIVERFKTNPRTSHQGIGAAVDAPKVDFVAEIRPGVQISADPQLLEHVFVNVIQNAIEAMPRGGLVSVLLNSKSDEAAIVVSDSGIGIAPENVDRLFKPFFSTKTRGTGLGLAISKKIIDAHGGGIFVSQRPTGGTEVSISIPLKRHGGRTEVALRGKQQE